MITKSDLLSALEPLDEDAVIMLESFDDDELIEIDSVIIPPDVDDETKQLVPSKSLFIIRFG
jgi:hypothetical protein